MRVRQHVNPLKSDFFRIPVERFEAPPGVALEVELGSAEGQFLVERADEEPCALFVGVEIRREMVDRARQICDERGIDNVRHVFANMAMDLPRLFSPGAVRRFHVNFPDPWFKSRQHKRRVVGPGLAADLEPLLAPGGEVSVMTDIFDIALEAMAAFEAVGLVNQRGPWSFQRERPFGARSRRERQCEGEGVRIWRLLYRSALA